MTSFMRQTACRAVGCRGDRRRKQGISENEALEKGLKEKSAEFADDGVEIYSKA